MLPRLQLACDHTSIDAALHDARAAGDAIDLLEAGTILLLHEGVKAIEQLKAARPELLLVADPKCVDAGADLARACKEAGCDIMTVSSAAAIETVRAAAEVVDEVQIELFGRWTFEDAEAWLDAGVSQAVYHQGRDGGTRAWLPRDLERIERLSDMGIGVSVTGGISARSLEQFAGLPVHSFIVGRAISDTADPRAAAMELKEEIARIWG